MELNLKSFNSLLQFEFSLRAPRKIVNVDADVPRAASIWNIGAGNSAGGEQIVLISIKYYNASGSI